MECDQVIRLYLETEREDELPEEAQKHIHSCSSCRQNFEKLLLLGEALHVDNFYKTRFDLSDKVMTAVHKYNAQREARKRIPVRNWLVVGVIFFFSIILVSYGDSFRWLEDFFGKRLELPILLILGAGLTIYAMVFVVSRMDELAALLKLKKYKEILKKSSALRS
jgi:uncharacterized membrane protein YcjF (UPF0283 family)